MGRSLVFFALPLALVMLFTACSGKQTPTSVPTPGFPYIEDLQGALLTTADLPAGWTAAQVTTSNELSTLSCGATAPDVQQVSVTAVFQADSGAHLTEAIAAFHSGQAEQWLNALQVGSTCTQISEAGSQGTPIASRVTRPAYPAMGDQTFSLRVTTAGPNATYATDVVYVRVGDFIIQIGNVTIGGPDLEGTESLVHQAIYKFRAAQTIRE